MRPETSSPLEMDREAPYTCGAWATADQPATHMDVNATRAAVLHKARLNLDAKPARCTPPGSRRAGHHSAQPAPLLASGALAARESMQSHSLKRPWPTGFSQYQLFWPACQGEC
jgi:hypothetical protein